jgi:hypothetical protein
MPIPIEQRKDLFELSSDLDMLKSYRKAIMDHNPRLWVLIHHNTETNNYGLEVNNSFGGICSQEEADGVRKVLSNCRTKSSPIKKPRKKKDVS